MRRVVLHGGEPTLRRDLGEIVAGARAIGFERVAIFTHARAAASHSGADWLAQMGADWFQVSIQAGTAAAHDAAVLAPAFAQTLAGAKNLIARGQRVKVNGVLTRHLLGTLPEFANLMIDLGPEEVGLDPIKPTGAFMPGRASYAELCPPLGPYGAAIARAICAMNEAGVTAFLTSFPPCFAPGAEHFVSEEPASTRGVSYVGARMNKLAWRRSLMVKREECKSCAYDETCSGVYTGYAEAHGLEELSPLPARRPIPPVMKVARDQDSPMTRALRSLFVRGSGSPVLRVRKLADGSHELACAAASGNFSVTVAARDAGAAYATTDHFAVRFRSDDHVTPDPRVLEVVIRTLRAAERYLQQKPRAPSGIAEGTHR